MTSPANLSRRTPSGNRSTFRGHFRWAVPIGVLLAGIAAFAVIQSFVPVYRAQALLKANNSHVLFPGVFPTAVDLATSDQALIYNAIILDPVLASPALRDAPSLSDPATAEANLKKNLTLASGGSKAQLVVSYVDTDREAASMVCNAVVDSYLRQRNAFDNNRINNLERWLEPELQRWEQDVEERQLVLHKLGDSRIAAEIQSNLALVTKFRALISDLQIELALQSRMHARSKKGTSEDDTSQQEKDSNREEMELRLEVVQEEYQALLRNTEKLGGVSTEIQFAKEKLDVANHVLMKLRERAAKVRTERRHDGAVHLLAIAVPPRVPIDSLPTKRIAVAAGTGFLLPFVVAWMVGFRRPRPFNTDDD